MGQGSLVCFSLWGHEELNMTEEQLNYFQNRFFNIYLHHTFYKKTCYQILAQIVDQRFWFTHSQ